MAETDDRLEDMLQRLEAEYNARNPRLGANLRDLIDRSPALKADIQQSLADGNLKEIKLFESNDNNTARSTAANISASRSRKSIWRTPTRPTATTKR